MFFKNKGWMEGTIDGGKTGMFPSDYVVPIDKSEFRGISKVKIIYVLFDRSYLYFNFKQNHIFYLLVM